MISLSLTGTAARELRILCLGCHSDDLEIGCGGTILRLVNELPDSVFHWVVFSAIGIRAEEARQSVTRFVEPSRLGGLTLQAFPDGFMPFEGAEIKSAFEELKRTVSPDLILTHNRNDAHQDHRLIAELTWNTFRDHLILVRKSRNTTATSVAQAYSSRSHWKCVRRRSGFSWTRFDRKAAETGSARILSSLSCGCAAWNATHRAAMPKHFIAGSCCFKPRTRWASRVLARSVPSHNRSVLGVGRSCLRCPRILVSWTTWVAVIWGMTRPRPR